MIVNGDKISSLEDVRSIYTQVDGPIPVLDEVAQLRTKAILDNEGFWCVAGALVSREIQTLGIATQLAMHDAPFFCNGEKSGLDFMVGPEFLMNTYQSQGVGIWTRTVIK
jgi:hypothetical protein